MSLCSWTFIDVAYSHFHIGFRGFEQRVHFTVFFCIKKVHEGTKDEDFIELSG